MSGLEGSAGGEYRHPLITLQHPQRHCGDDGHLSPSRASLATATGTRG